MHDLFSPGVFDFVYIHVSLDRLCALILNLYIVWCQIISHLSDDIVMPFDINGINTRSQPMNVLKIVYVPIPSSQSLKYVGIVA